MVKFVLLNVSILIQNIYVQFIAIDVWWKCIIIILLSHCLDGMTDCSDSECCNSPSCAEHIMCLASNDPLDVLLRKQPPSVTASFYQRVKFLVEEHSVQSYAHLDEYSER